VALPGAAGLARRGGAAAAPKRGGGARGGGARLAAAAAASAAAPPASTLRQAAPYGAEAASAALERRVTSALIAARHPAPFLPPSGAVGAPLSPGVSVRAAGAFSDPPRGGAIPGARGGAHADKGAGSVAAAAAAACGGTGRLFDASGRRLVFFDPSLRQGC
jgi:hypothetical protein